MTKTYKHRTMGRTTQKEVVGRGYEVNMGGSTYYVDIPVIDDFSDDRIEVVEKDWISKLYLDIGDYVAINDDIPGERQFRASIEQHMPKEKKFTKQDIRKIADNFTANNEYRFQVIQDFLKSHNLLSYTVE